MFTKEPPLTRNEILVVLIVLVVLVLFVYPIVPISSIAGPKARNILCQTNLLGYGTAFAMYLDDYDQQFPNARFWLLPDSKRQLPYSQCYWHNKGFNPNGYSESPQFWKYVADKQTDLCPTSEHLAVSGLGEHHPGHNPDIPINPQYSYSLNAYLGPGPFGLVQKFDDIESNPGRIASFTEQNLMWNIKKRSRYNPDLNSFMFLTRTATYHLAPSVDIEIDETDDNANTVQDGVNYPKWGLTRGSGNVVFLDQHVQLMPFWVDSHEYAYPLRDNITRPDNFWPNLSEYYK